MKCILSVKHSTGFSKHLLLWLWHCELFCLSLKHLELLLVLWLTFFQGDLEADNSLSNLADILVIWLVSSGLFFVIVFIALLLVVRWVHLFTRNGAFEVREESLSARTAMFIPLTKMCT